MPNFLGAKHWVGFKPQTVPGTAETTVTTFLPTENISMNAKPTHIPRKTHIGTGRNLPLRLGYTKPEGKCTSEVMASQPQPWYWLLGHVVTTQPAISTDPTVYLHTITATEPVNLTVEGDKVYQKAKQADAKVNKITLSGQVGEVANLALEWFGLKHTEPATLTSTPTYPTDVDLLTVRSATIKIAGTPDVTIENFEISYDTGLEQLPTIEDVAGAPHSVRVKDPSKAAGKFKFIDFPVAELARLVAAAQFALIVELDGPIISATYKKFLRVTLPACQYTGGFDNDIAESVITGEGSFEGFYDTVTGNQILVEAQNSVVTINT